MNASAQRNFCPNFTSILTLLLFVLACECGNVTFEYPPWEQLEPVEQQQQHMQEQRPGTGTLVNVHNVLSSQFRGVAVPNDKDAAKHTVGDAAGKVLNFFEKVAVQVGSGVKNTVLHHLAEAHSSALVKKAKFLIYPPVTELSVVEEKLNRVGNGLLKFSNMISRVPPDKRAKLMSSAIAAMEKLRCIRRKYNFFNVLPRPDHCYRSMRALRKLMIDILKDPSAYGSTHASVDMGILTPVLSSTETQKLLDIFYEQTKYMLFCLTHIFTNEQTVITELYSFVEKMLPEWKSTLALAWRLSSMLERQEEVTSKRILAEFVNDTLGFDSGLLTAAVSIDRSLLNYDPRTEYYYCTPPNAPSERVSLRDAATLHTPHASKLE